MLRVFIVCSCTQDEDLLRLDITREERVDGVPYWLSEQVERAGLVLSIGQLQSLLSSFGGTFSDTSREHPLLHVLVGHNTHIDYNVSQTTQQLLDSWGC